MTIYGIAGPRTIQHNEGRLQIPGTYRLINPPRPLGTNEAFGVGGTDGGHFTTQRCVGGVSSQATFLIRALNLSEDSS